MTASTLGRRAVAGRPRRGLTIVEVLVAVVLLSVAIIALASSAAVGTRQTSDGVRRTRAAGLAEARFEALAAKRGLSMTACDAIVPLGGTVSFDTTTRGIRERGSITRPLNDGTVTVVDRVILRPGRDSVIFRSVIRCF